MATVPDTGSEFLTGMVDDDNRLTKYDPLTAWLKPTAAKARPKRYPNEGTDGNGPWQQLDMLADVDAPDRG